MLRAIYFIGEALAQCEETAFLGFRVFHTIISYAPKPKLDLSMAVNFAGWMLLPSICRHVSVNSSVFWVLDGASAGAAEGASSVGIIQWTITTKCRYKYWVLQEPVQAVGRNALSTFNLPLWFDVSYLSLTSKSTKPQFRQRIQVIGIFSLHQYLQKRSRACALSGKRAHDATNAHG